MRLRIVGTARHGQLVDIPGTRCSIGSSPACTLRLRATGVRPVHCLVLRTSDGHSVRSLSADTTLNGRSFREQSLRPGDRLRVGPIELEVVGEVLAGRQLPAEESDTPPLPIPEPQAAAELSTGTNSLGREAAEFFARLERLERHVERARTPTPRGGDTDESDDEADARLSDVLPDGTYSVSAATGDASLQPERERQQEQERAPEWERERTQLESQRNYLEAERQRLETELAVTRDEWFATQQLLTHRINHWESLQEQSQEELVQLRAELTSQQIASAFATTGLREDIERLTRELETERDSLDRARRAWDEDRERLAVEAQAIQARCSELEKLLAAKGESLEHERQVWNEERGALQSELELQRSRCSQLEQEAQTLREECEQLTRRLRELENASESRASGVAENAVEAAEIPAQETRESQAEAPALPPTSAGVRRSELNWLAQQWGDAKRDAGPESPQHNSASAFPDPSCESVSPVLPADRTAAADAAPFAVAAAPDHDVESTSETPADDLGVRATRSGNVPDESDRGREVAADTSDPCEIDDDDDVFSRLRRAGIWCPVEGMPSAFDSEPDACEERTPGAVSPSRGKERVAPTDVAGTEMAGGEPDAGGEPPYVPACRKWQAEEGAPAGDPVGISENAPCDSGESVSGEDFESGVSEPSTDNDPAEQGADALMSRRGMSLDDDSIESYMERLLDRMRGAAPSTPPAASTPAAATEKMPISEIDLAAPMREASAQATKQRLDPDEYLPRSQAPEQNANMAAMREIANSTRRTHLLSHARRTSNSKSRTKLLAAVTAIAAACASVFYLNSHPHLALPGLVVTTAMALWFVFQALAVRRRVFDGLRLDTEELHGSRTESSPAPPAESPASPDESPAPPAESPASPDESPADQNA